MELISRDEVMRLAESGKLLSGSFGERAKDIIKAIPTIEERKEGKWVRITQDVGLRPHQYMCTECHRIIEYSSSESPSLLEMKYPYCHCGAKMKGEPMIIDYITAKECKEITYGICYKCEKCGRKFNEYGYMTDDGGTTIEEEEE